MKTLSALPGFTTDIKRDPVRLSEYIVERMTSSETFDEQTCTSWGGSWVTVPVRGVSNELLINASFCFDERYGYVIEYLRLLPYGDVEVYYLLEGKPEWSKDLLNNLPKLEKYIQWQLTSGEYLSKSQCDASGNSWVSVRVINELGQYIMNIPVCFGLQFNYQDAYLRLFNNGAVQILELRELTVEEQIKAFFEAAIRSAAVIAALGAGLGIDSIIASITKVNSSVGALLTFVNSEIKPIVDRVQKASAWIEKTFHVDLLKRLNTIGEAISPEYRSMVRSYETYLTSASEKIFGNSAILPSYMRFYEAMLYDQMKRAGETKDKARYETLKASYNRTKAIGDQIDEFSGNPMAVWDYIYASTFEDMNPYIDKERIFRDQAVLKLAGELAAVAAKTDAAVKNIGKFATMLEVDLIGEDTPVLKTLTDRFTTFYSNKVEPGVRAVQSENKRLDSEIKKVEAEREAERKARERAALLSTPPGELSPGEKAQQSTQFLDMFNSALQPQTKEPAAVTTDIEDIVGRLYE